MTTQTQPTHAEQTRIDYDDDAAWRADFLISCTVCKKMWFNAPTDRRDGSFSVEILECDGVIVCEDCSPRYCEEMLS
jgi:hypothetical protein